MRVFIAQLADGRILGAAQTKSGAQRLFAEALRQHYSAIHIHPRLDLAHYDVTAYDPAGEDISMRTVGTLTSTILKD